MANFRNEERLNLLVETLGPVNRMEPWVLLDMLDGLGPQPLIRILLQELKSLYLDNFVTNPYDIL